MDIRVLRYFLAVAREENITRAAESLHITQPSLSKQLMDLEQELGKKLLVRGKRKVTLTENGVLLRKRADEIVALLEKTEQEIGSERKELSGEVDGHSHQGADCQKSSVAGTELKNEHMLRHVLVFLLAFMPKNILIFCSQNYIFILLYVLH